MIVRLLPRGTIAACGGRQAPGPTLPNYALAESIFQRAVRYNGRPRAKSLRLPQHRYPPLPLGLSGKIVRPKFWSAFLASAVVVVVACGGGYQRPVPPTPIPDPRLALAEPVAVPRVGERGAPVDCSIRIANNSGTTLNRVILACELLDADGVPVGTGLGTAQNIPNGQSRSIRTVVYGVRNFATARALVTSATFAGEGS
jgi:hypothetical protein